MLASASFPWPRPAPPSSTTLFSTFSFSSSNALSHLLHIFSIFSSPPHFPFLCHLLVSSLLTSFTHLLFGLFLLYPFSLISSLSSSFIFLFSLLLYLCFPPPFFCLFLSLLLLSWPSWLLTLSLSFPSVVISLFLYIFSRCSFASLSLFIFYLIILFYILSKCESLSLSPSLSLSLYTYIFLFKLSSVTRLTLHLIFISHFVTLLSSLLFLHLRPSMHLSTLSPFLNLHFFPPSTSPPPPCTHDILFSLISLDMPLFSVSNLYLSPFISIRIYCARYLGSYPLPIVVLSSFIYVYFFPCHLLSISSSFVFLSSSYVLLCVFFFLCVSLS